jgi:hypothetical protein
VDRRFVFWVLPALAATMVSAPPAAADDAADFLSVVQPRYQVLTPAQLLAAGNRACSIIGSGRPAADAVEILNQELGVDVPVVSQIVRAAVIYLHC